MRLLCLILAVLTGNAAEIRWRALNEPGSGGAMTSIGLDPRVPGRILLGGDMLGAGLTEDGGQFWLPTTGFKSWELADFTFHPADPDTVWAGTMSGPYLSRDGGRTWESKRAGLPAVSSGMYSAPVQKVLIDTANPARLLAFGGSHRRWASPGTPAWGAVWLSEDSGDSWTRLATIAGGANIVGIAATQELRTIYAAANQRGIWRSDDSGATWSDVTANLPHRNVNDVAIHPADPNTLWAALGNSRAGELYQPGGIWKSIDAGASWTPASTGLPQRANGDTNQASRFERITVAPADGNRLFTSDTAWSTASVWRSDDGGANWTLILNANSKARVPTAYNPGPGMTVIDADSANPDSVFIANSEYLLHSRDAGVTWSDLLADRADDGTYRGRGFSGLVATNFIFHPERDDTAIFLAMDDGKFWQSTNSLESWRYAGQGIARWGGGNDAVYAGPDRRTIYATFGQAGSFAGIARSRDAGLTWAVLSGGQRGLPAMNSPGQPLGIHALPDDANSVWATAGGKLLRSLDGGDSWAQIEGVASAGWIAHDPRNPRTLYVTSAAGVYRTEDGESFTLMEGSPSRAERIRVDPHDPAVLWATVWRQPHGGLWRFRDGSWSRIRSDVYIKDVAIDPFNPARLAVSTDDNPYHDHMFSTGVWLSSDGGETWSQQNTGLPMLRVPVIRFDPHRPGRLVAGLGGRGFALGEIVEEPLQ